MQGKQSKETPTKNAWSLTMHFFYTTNTFRCDAPEKFLSAAPSTLKFVAK